MTDFIERARALERLAHPDLRAASRAWQLRSGQAGYIYVQDWLGLPVIQRPDDIVQFQAICHAVRPDVIVETGIARGGSVLLSASMLCLLDVLEGRSPLTSHRRVVAVDVDIRPHTREALDAHPLRPMVALLEGSSVAPAVVREVRRHVAGQARVLVVLDSDHTHDHVLAELDAYAPLVSPGSYCIVFDTIIEDMPAGAFPHRPWGPGNNPMTAVREWLGRHPEFEVDAAINQRLLVSAAPGGYLRRRA